MRLTSPLDSFQSLVQNGLELMIASHCLRLLSAGITDVCHHTWHNANVYDGEVLAGDQTQGLAHAE